MRRKIKGREEKEEGEEEQEEEERKREKKGRREGRRKRQDFIRVSYRSVMWMGHLQEHAHLTGSYTTEEKRFSLCPSDLLPSAAGCF